MFGSAGNALYRNANDGQHKQLFVDATDAAGVRNGSLGWGATMFDMNNDKYIDFIMTNGKRCVLYHNTYVSYISFNHMDVSLLPCFICMHCI